MIPSLEFFIDKEANFIYWAQLLIGPWSWYFEKENSILFSNEIGQISNFEQKALDELKNILQNKNNQYKWLWERYNNFPLVNIQKQKEYSFVKETLTKKFNIFWDKEIILLDNWKNELDQYDFNKFNDLFKKLSIFLGIKDNKDVVSKIRVKLFISSNFPSGATRPDFNDLMILNVSRVPIMKINRVVGVISHEFAHFINNKSGLIKLLLKSSAFPSEKLDEGYKWEYLIAETILKSISSSRANTYSGLFLSFSEQEKRQDENLSHQNPLKSYSYEFLIRIAANHILQNTIDYLDNNKMIDKNFIELTIKTLLNLIKERENGK
ncbi:hypothetical protein HZC33_02540 [Candidatus Wolfebacteria bacterium]|nr:hypothetical protein [Candidatus Wolfebacteria bacterium]